MAFHISVRLPHLLMAVSLIVVLCSVPFKLSQNNNSVRSAASWLLLFQAKKNICLCVKVGETQIRILASLFFYFFHLLSCSLPKFECIFFNVWHHTAYCLALLLSGMYRKCSLRGISDTHRQINGQGAVQSDPFFIPIFSLHLLDF